MHVREQKSTIAAGVVAVESAPDPISNSFFQSITITQLRAFHIILYIINFYYEFILIRDLSIYAEIFLTFSIILFHVFIFILLPTKSSDERNISPIY